MFRLAYSTIYMSTHLAIGTAPVLIDGLGPGYQCNYGEDVIADNAVSAEHEEERHQREFAVPDVFYFFAQG